MVDFRRPGHIYIVTVHIASYIAIYVAMGTLPDMFVCPRANTSGKALVTVLQLTCDTIASQCT